MVDLDVTLRVVLAIGLVKVERAYCAGSSVFFYSQSSIHCLSLVGNMCANKLAAFFTRYRLFGRRPGGDLIYLQRILGYVFAPATRYAKLRGQAVTFVIEKAVDEGLHGPTGVEYGLAVLSAHPSEHLIDQTFLGSPEKVADP